MPNTQSLSKEIDDLLQFEKELSAEKEILIRKALSSDDPAALIKARNYQYAQFEKTSHAQGKSFIFDPMEVGQNNRGWRQNYQSVPPNVLRQMGRTPYVRTIINTRIDQIADFAEYQDDKFSTGWIIEKRGVSDNKKLTDADKRVIDELTEIIENCGRPKKSKGKGGGRNWTNENSFEKFIRKIAKDSLELDAATFEVIENRAGKISEFYGVDAATMYIADDYESDRYSDADRREALKDGHYPEYVQVMHNQILAEFYPWELCYGIRNPSTEMWRNGYGNSELNSLIATVTSLLNADAYNANFFKIGSAPKGILTVKGGINKRSLEEFKQQWRAEMSGVENCIDYSTRILTKEFGGEQIGEILDGKDEQKITIWTGEKWEKAIAYKSAKKKLCRTKLNNGIEFKSSSEHRIKVVGEDGKPCWKEQKDLKVGDYVLVAKYMDLFEVSYDWKGNYHVEKIVEIKRTDAEVQMYDVEVYDNVNQFVANGFISHNSHRIPVLNSEKAEFHNTHTPNKDMEYSQYRQFLIRLACVMYRMSPKEVGLEDEGGNSMIKSGGDTNKEISYSKSKGLKPVLKFIQRKINKYIIERENPEFHFRFIGLETNSAAEELENDIKSVQYIETINEVRERRGLPAIDLGDIPLNPVALQAKAQEQMQGGGMEQDPAGEWFDEEVEQGTESNPIEQDFNRFIENLNKKSGI